jgi:hypothetical protein
MSAMVIANGGLATTRNGRPGKLKRSASISTTRTVVSANLRRSAAARPGCSSTAITRAPVSASAAVTRPSPAPKSSTHSPGRIDACATTDWAQSASSRCQPDRRPTPAGTEHHHEATHGLSQPAGAIAFRGHTRIGQPKRPEM